MRKLNVVAHQDDTLLFMSPDIVDDAADGFTVQTVVVTDGWSTTAGLDNPAYVASRNVGLRDALATMADVGDPDWTVDYLVVLDQPVARSTLADQAVVFLGLAEYGHSGGSGPGGCDEQGTSLTALEAGCVPSVTADDGITYTRDDLVQSLFDIINEFGPDEIRLQDPDPADGFPAHATGTYPWPDHPDHVAVARLAGDAAERYQAEVDDGVVITRYRCYNTAGEPAANVTGDRYAAKLAAFVTYAGHDADGGVQSHDDPSGSYFRWLQRQFYRA